MDMSGDSCDILPAPNGTADQLIKIVKEANPDTSTDKLKIILDDCLLPSNGYFWG